MPRIETASAGGRGDRSGLTVLVVDDDPTVHDVLAATLAKEGYRVLHARDGAEALDILRKTPPDIVTLDVMMPKLDGWSVLGMMKSDPALDHIPVIMITIVDDRNLGYSLGASEFMTKPIDRTRLLELLRRFAATTRRGGGADRRRRSRRPRGRAQTRREVRPEDGRGRERSRRARLAEAIRRRR